MRITKIEKWTTVGTLAFSCILSTVAIAAPADSEFWPGTAPWRDAPEVFKVLSPSGNDSRLDSRNVLTAPEETSEALLEALSEGRHMPEYNTAYLRNVIDEFNLTQHKKHGVMPIKERPDGISEYRDTRPEGHTQLELADWGNYFVIYTEQVIRTHFDLAIDGGIDSYTSTFFKKKPVERVLELPGPTYPMPDPFLVLSIPQTASCAGYVPDGVLSVHDLRGGFTFTAKLPTGTLSVKLKNLADNAISIRTSSEEPSRNENRHTCEIGNWVKKIDSTFTLKCNSSKQKCTFRRIARLVSEGCEHIGGCD